eukprot:1140422-Pelagomonas_calceolata.AAC.2
MSTCSPPPGPKLNILLLLSFPLLSPAGLHVFSPVVAAEREYCEEATARGELLLRGKPGVLLTHIFSCPSSNVNFHYHAQPSTSQDKHIYFRARSHRTGQETVFMRSDTVSSRYARCDPCWHCNTNKCSNSLA